MQPILKIYIYVAYLKRYLGNTLMFARQDYNRHYILLSYDYHIPGPVVLRFIAYIPYLEFGTNVS